MQLLWNLVPFELNFHNRWDNNEQTEFCTSKYIFSYQIQSNLPILSPLLSNHLYLKVTFFLSFYRKYHMN